MHYYKPTIPNHLPIGDVHPDVYLTELAERIGIYDVLLSMGKSWKGLYDTERAQLEDLDSLIDFEKRRIAKELSARMSRKRREDIPDEYVLKFVSAFVESVV